MDGRHFLLIALCLIALPLTGCATPSAPERDRSDAAEASATDIAQQDESQDAEASDDSEPEVADSAEATANRLMEALSRSEGAPPGEGEAERQGAGPQQQGSSAREANQTPPPEPGQVQWRDAAARSLEDLIEPTSPTQAVAEQMEDPDPVEPETAAEAETARTEPVDPVAELSRDELVEALAKRVRRGDAPPVQHGVAAAGLSLMQGRPSIKQDMLAALHSEQRRQLARFYEVTRRLAEELKSGSARLDRDRVFAEMERVFGELPIHIDTLALCKQVEGYGVYTPFGNYRFLAGEPRKVIVYLELDHFHPAEVDDRYEVKLEQEILLFNASDGLAVWSRDPVTIVDQSRNRRQDFFTVQLITLPARLNVGKYRLKVRVTDLHGGSVAETTIPLELVAREELASSQE